MKLNDEKKFIVNKNLFENKTIQLLNPTTNSPKSQEEEKIKDSDLIS